MKVKMTIFYGLLTEKKKRETLLKIASPSQKRTLNTKWIHQNDKSADTAFVYQGSQKRESGVLFDPLSVEIACWGLCYEQIKR